MTFIEVVTDVSRILKDPGQVVFTKSTIAKYMTSAVRRVLNSTNAAVGRTTLSMVSAQQQYDLPAGIRRITRLRLVPEQGGEPTELTQYLMSQIPYTTLTPRDPYAFALVSGQNTSGEDRLSLFVWPAPARSASNAFVIDYEVNYGFTGSTADNTKIYVTETLMDVVGWLTAADCLMESDDASDIQKSQVLRAQAERRLVDNATIESLSLRADKNRAFP